MGFIPYKTEDGHVIPTEYMACSAITPKAGMALTLSSGKLAIATGTTAPSYISMCEKGAAVSAGDIIPVARVEKGIIYAVPCSASMADVNIGAKVTLHASTGLSVTATTTNGVAEIVAYPNGTANGAVVLVRF